MSGNGINVGAGLGPRCAGANGVEEAERGRSEGSSPPAKAPIPFGQIQTSTAERAKINRMLAAKVEGSVGVAL